MTVNKVILIGNLGADPELRTAGQTQVANLRLATTERRKDRDGNWTDHTEWHKVVCFGRTAENVAKFCRKGKQLYIEGSLRTQTWQDKEGKDRWSTEVVANEIRFLGGGERQDRDSGSSGGGGQQEPSGDWGSGGGSDSDIPF